MAGKRIPEKERFASIKRQQQWIKAAKRLGLRVTHGGKHPYVIRDPDNPNDADFRSSVTTVPSHLHKIMNEKIFHQLCDSPVSKRLGITEQMIWDALGF